MVTQVKDYDAALDLELDSMDKFVLQCLAFYQVCYTVKYYNSSRFLILEYLTKYLQTC
jgi:hypothetical protein